MCAAQSCSFTFHEATRQQVLAAMRADYRQGDRYYGALFYRDFARNPGRYGIYPHELRELQQRAFMTYALHRWQPLDSVEELSELKAASNNAINISDAGLALPFFLSPRNLKKLGIEQASFDTLVKLLGFRYIDALQNIEKQGTLSYEQVDDLLVPKVFMGLGYEERLDYKAAVQAMGYKPGKEGFRPIGELIDDVVYGYRQGFPRDRSGGSSDLAGSLEASMLKLYLRIEKADVEKTPVKRMFFDRSARCAEVANELILPPATSVFAAAQNAAVPYIRP